MSVGLFPGKDATTLRWAIAQLRFTPKRRRGATSLGGLPLAYI
jgi:hypothetical protein